MFETSVFNYCSDQIKYIVFILTKEDEHVTCIVLSGDNIILLCKPHL